MAAKKPPVETPTNAAEAEGTTAENAALEVLKLKQEIEDLKAAKEAAAAELEALDNDIESATKELDETKTYTEAELKAIQDKVNDKGHGKYTALAKERGNQKGKDNNPLIEKGQGYEITLSKKGA